jgi:glycosyltransferase involved in cell wall biosynthesis
MAWKSVLLATEGTYPYHGGGVSTWCHLLTRGLEEIDFTLLAVTMHPYVARRFELGRNIQRLVTVPLWGTADPAESRPNLNYAAFITRRRAAASDDACARFIAAHGRFVQAALCPEGASADQLASSLVGLHRHFAECDYQTSFAAPEAWRSFAAIATSLWKRERPDADIPTLAQLTEAWRLLFRFLIVLDVDIPTCDLTHSAAAGLSGLPCVIAKLTRGTPYLLTEHGVYLREQSLNLGRSIEAGFTRWFVLRVMAAVVDLNYAHADLVAPVCNYNTRWERWRGVDEDRIRVVYNGVNPARFPPLPLPTNERPTVVSVAQIFPLKGQLDLIEAAALVRKDFPAVEFQLYGSAVDHEYLQACTDRVRALGLEDTVSFRGATANPSAAYGGADVVALASISEGFPYAIIEAMLSRRAVVATDVGGVSEAVGNEGVLVPPHEPAQLAAAITSLLRSASERERLARLAYQRARDMFSEEKFLNSYRAAYTELAGCEARSSMELAEPAA